MLRATTSWFLLITAFFIVLISACITDCVIKLLHYLRFKSASRVFFVKFSQFTELLLKFWGTRIEIDTSAMNIDQRRPVLFVSSHHSSMDVTLLGNHLSRCIKYRKLSFVCRGGLDRWLPAFSFYTRQYCYSLTRRGAKSALGSSPFALDEPGLAEFATRIDSDGDALVIFPEGVKPINDAEGCRSFRRKGLRILLENMPNAQIVPIGIAGTGSFYTTPRSFKDVTNNWPRFNRRLQVQLLPVLHDFQLTSIEDTIDILEAQIFASYEKLRNPKATACQLNGLNQKWIQ
ncbi:MAG: 1-acyl-sn-glycerol-3-phosphate acyltransferase [Granulosicoccus sp.]